MKRAGVRPDLGDPDWNFADVMARVQRVVGEVEPHDSVERYSGLGVECPDRARRASCRPGPSSSRRPMAANRR